MSEEAINGLLEKEGLTPDSKLGVPIMHAETFKRIMLHVRPHLWHCSGTEVETCAVRRAAPSSGSCGVSLSCIGASWALPIVLTKTVKHNVLHVCGRLGIPDASAEGTPTCRARASVRSLIT